MSKLKYKYGPGETPIERLRNKLQVLFGVVTMAEVDVTASKALKDLAAKASKVFDDISDLLDDVSIQIKE